MPSQRRGLSASQVVDEACLAAGEPDVEVWGYSIMMGARI